MKSAHSGGQSPQKDTSSESDHSSTGVRASKKPLILGHRGFRAQFPENTALSFSQAILHGADGFECDIQMCRDGHFVIIHDETVDRTATDGIKGSIADMTLAELKRIDFGKGEYILELGELLAIYKEAYINLELKEETIRPEHCESIARIINTIGNKQNLLISSFRHDLLPYFKDNGYKTGMLMRTGDLLMHPLGCYRNIVSTSPDYVNMPINTLRVPWRLYILPIIKALKNQKMKIAFWTVNSPKDMAHAFQYGDIIITDDVVAGRDRLLR
jgi:glycerophosphoryl diester phosphodiesterase